MADNTPNPLSKLFGQKADDTPHKSDNSLVESIVRKAQEAAQKNEPLVSIAENTSEADEIDAAHLKARVAQHVLTGVITVSLLASIGLYAAVAESNPILGLIGQDNIASHLQKKNILQEQLTAQEKSIKASMVFIQLEKALSGLLTLDTEDPLLSFSRAENATAGVAQEGAPQTYRVMESSGAIVALSEEQLSERQKQATLRQMRALSIVESAQKDLAAIEKDIASQGKEIQEQAMQISSALSRVDTASKGALSLLSLSSIRDAKTLSLGLLKTVKDKTLRSLTKDIQDQADTLVTRYANTAALPALTEISDVTKTISSGNPQSFEKAITRIKAISLESAEDAEIAAAVGDIVSDLTATGIIASNLGRSSYILELSENRINWPSIIDQVQKTARLGADGKRDSAPVSDAKKDIDPDGIQVRLIAYEGKKDKNQIDIRGELLGQGAYANRNFALLADIMDALEASTSFKDVSGFSFSKNRSASGEYVTPINVTVTLQKSGETDIRDIPAEKPFTPQTITATPAVPASTSPAPAPAPAATPTAE